MSVVTKATLSTPAQKIICKLFRTKFVSGILSCRLPFFPSLVEPSTDFKIFLKLNKICHEEFSGVHLKLNQFNVSHRVGWFWASFAAQKWRKKVLMNTIARTSPFLFCFTSFIFLEGIKNFSILLDCTLVSLRDWLKMVSLGITSEHASLACTWSFSLIGRQFVNDTVEGRKLSSHAVRKDDENTVESDLR